MRMLCSRTLALTAALVLISTPKVGAAIYECAYTEPFLTTVYDSAARTLTVVHDVEKRRDIIRGVRMSKAAAGALELRNRNAVVQRIDLRSRGSDGMSGRTYPYKGEWLAENAQGGCTRVR